MLPSDHSPHTVAQSAAALPPGLTVPALSIVYVMTVAHSEAKTEMPEEPGLAAVYKVRGGLAVVLSRF